MGENTKKTGPMGVEMFTGGGELPAPEVDGKIHLLPPALPGRLDEPELSAYRATHARIAAARAALIAAEETWAILAPVLASRYQLTDGDRIAPDGTILREAEA